MITLDLPPKIEQNLISQATNAGLSIEKYLLNHIEKIVEPKPRQLGGGESYLLRIDDNFDEPMDDFKEYI